MIAIFFAGALSAGQKAARPLFHTHRLAASDLEVSGRVRDLPPGASQFVSREWIEALPQVSLTMKRNEDFPGLPKKGVAVSGVYLDALAQSLGADADASAIEAICQDGYSATYSREYMRHRPFLVLKIEGMGLHDWAIKNHQYDAEPYFIGYDEFVPAFQVLAHQDQRLEPAGIVRIRFATEQAVYDGIRPTGMPVALSTSVMQGFRIARQNCFRCHNAGDHGGTKAAKDWHTLGAIAKQRPQWFRAWVRDPQAITPGSEMPPNKKYDKATLVALQRYFATFAVEAQ